MSTNVYAPSSSAASSSIQESEMFTQESDFYDWRQLFPSLIHLLQLAPLLARELKARGPNSSWTQWPETSLYLPEDGHEWDVIPIVHTFPADDVKNIKWLSSSCAALPQLAAALRDVDGLRTALLSRLGPKTVLTPHTGWAELSNHVLRVHLPLELPASPGVSGVTCGVSGETQPHVLGEFLVFDDSVVHSGYNHHETESRTVLIIDILRPTFIRKGSASTGTTRELTNLIDYFKS